MFKGQKDFYLFYFVKRNELFYSARTHSVEVTVKTFIILPNKIFQIKAVLFLKKNNFVLIKES